MTRAGKTPALLTNRTNRDVPKLSTNYIDILKGHNTSDSGDKNMSRQDVNQRKSKGNFQGYNCNNRNCCKKQKSNSEIFLISIAIFYAPVDLKLADYNEFTVTIDIKGQHYGVMDRERIKEIKK